MKMFNPSRREFGETRVHGAKKAKNCAFLGQLKWSKHTSQRNGTHFPWGWGCWG